MISLLGIFIILLICFLFSRAKKDINWRIVLTGLALQAFFAFFILHTAAGQKLFLLIGEGVTKLIEFSDEGGRFAFGNYLYDLPEFIFAFHVTSTIIFVCALFSLLTYLKVLHPILKFFSVILQKIMGVSGAEVLAAIGSALVGQVESALPLRAYLSKLSNAQFFAIMAGGMSTMSIALLSVYANIGIPIKYLLTANLMGIPAGLLTAKILYPSTQEEANQPLPEPEDQDAHNVMDAIVKGAQEGFKISMAIIAVAIGIISITALVNAIFGLGHTSLAEVFGYIFYPFAKLLGASGENAKIIGSLIGEKLALNEFIAYSTLADMIKTAPMGEHFIMLSTFAICGFANLGSIAIQLGAFSQMLPEKREVLASMGFPAMLAGALASLLSACWANLFFQYFN